MVEQKAPKEFEVTDTVLVSNRRQARFFVEQGKKALEKFERIEFQALGSAISLCVEAAETLVRYLFAN